MHNALRAINEMAVDKQWALNCRKRFISARLWDIAEEKEEAAETITDNDWSVALFLNRIEALSKEKLKLAKELRQIDRLMLPSNGITDEMIAMARQYPIDKMIEFKRGNALCLWHNEKNPSMRYYPQTNTVYCWSCQKSAGAIDVCMKIDAISFVEAVKRLSGTYCHT